MKVIKQLMYIIALSFSISIGGMKSAQATPIEALLPDQNTFYGCGTLSYYYHTYSAMGADLWAFVYDTGYVNLYYTTGSYYMQTCNP